jgi:hypothetical protein
VLLSLSDVGITEDKLLLWLVLTRLPHKDIIKFITSAIYCIKNVDAETV